MSVTAVPTLAFILSASHSGSTLLAMLLGAQPRICTVGELQASSLGDPSGYRCSCGVPIQNCRFWKDLAHAMVRHGVPDFDITRATTSIYDVRSRYALSLLAPLPRGPLLEQFRDLALSLSPQWRRHLHDSQRRNAALVAALSEVTGARIVVDSSKLALRLKYLLRNDRLNVRVIHLLRDGRAVACAYTDEWNLADAADPALRGGGSGTKRLSPERTMADAAREWRRSHEAAECVLSQLPRDQWTVIQYEDLCRHPEPALRRLCAFLDVPANQVSLDFRARPQHVIGNGMRLDSTSDIRLDDRWRTLLSVGQLHVFERVAGDLNRRYGYQ